MRVYKDLSQRTMIWMVIVICIMSYPVLAIMLAHLVALARGGFWELVAGLAILAIIMITALIGVMISISSRRRSHGGRDPRSWADLKGELSVAEERLAEWERLRSSGAVSQAVHR